MQYSAVRTYADRYSRYCDIYGCACFCASSQETAVTPLVNNTAVSSGAITLGQYVTVNAAGSGGAGGYTYAVQYRKDTDTSWKLRRYYSSASSVIFKPTEAGNYYLYVKVKDSEGVVEGKRFALKVYPDINNKSTISAAEIYLGDTVKLKGSAVNGAGEYTYAFLYKKSTDTSWTVKQFYKSNNEVEIKPLKAVDYDFAVKVQDKNGRLSVKEFSVKVYSKLKNTSAVSSAEAEPGETVTVNGAASGGKAGYTYSLMYKAKTDSAWSVAQSRSTVSSMTFTPETEGTYTLCAIVRDAKNTAVKKYFNLTVSKKQEELDDIDKILSEIITQGMTETDKVRAIHNWLVNNVRYDEEGCNSGRIPDTSFTAEGLFETRVAVCDGYAKAFAVLAERAGFEAIRVTGVGYNGSGSSESHAWNQVKVNGKWYNVDVTWDDPIVSEDYGDNLSYKYFLVPDSVINQDHAAESTKNSCTSEQPVDLFIDDVIEEEKQALPGVIFCSTDDEFGDAVFNMDVFKDGDYNIVFRTDHTTQELSELIGNNMPSGFYSLSMSFKSWKISGYSHIVLTVSVS